MTGRWLSSLPMSTLAPKLLPSQQQLLQTQQEQLPQEAFPLTEERFSQQSQRAGRVGRNPQDPLTPAPPGLAVLCPWVLTPPWTTLPWGLRKGTDFTTSSIAPAWTGAGPGLGPQPLLCLQREASHRAPRWPDRSMAARRTPPEPEDTGFPVSQATSHQQPPQSGPGPACRALLPACCGA